MDINTIQELSIITNKNCNLECSYCTQTHSKEVLKEETFIQFFKDFNFKNLDRIINIDFFGGEPLLNFEIIKFIGNYLYSNLNENQRKMIYFKTNTNCTIMNQEIIEYFQFLSKEFNFRLIISYDGLWQDQRSSTEQHKLIRENIDKIYSTCLKNVAQISFSVLNHGRDILKNHLYIKSLFPVADSGIKFYTIREPWSWDDEKFNDYKQGFIEYLKFYLIRNKQGHIPGYISAKENELNNPKNGCGMGYHRFSLFPDYNKTEKLSPCGLDNNFLYDEVIPEEKIISNCENCEIKNYCNKICPKKITYKDSNNRNLLCEIKKFEYYVLKENTNLIKGK